MRYTITFSENGYYQASPQVFPVFRKFDWRGAVNLRLLDARLADDFMKSTGILTALLSAYQRE